MIADPTAPPRASMNDDRSPLLTLMSCVDCGRTMRLETSYPDSDGKDLLQYRCSQCGSIERVRLIRRTWPARS
jgi:RNase P subunit RPR2